MDMAHRAAYRFLDRDQIDLRKLPISAEIESCYNWTTGDLSERSYNYNVQDVLSL
jgi:hypothetical protein